MNRRRITFLMSTGFLIAFFLFALSTVVQGAQLTTVAITTLVVGEPSPVPSSEKPSTPFRPQTTAQVCVDDGGAYHCTIAAATTWQQTPLLLQQGAAFNIVYTSGNWTIDFRNSNFGYVGPDGYASNIDNQIATGCKEETSLPYARLLGQIGSGPAFSVGAGGTFVANASGALALRINDQDNCLTDNDGSIVLQAQAGISCANVAEIPITECNALIALYNSTNGPSWNDHTGWLDTLTPCSWFGISCLNGHVYLLVLRDNQLSGVLPAQLGDFPEMLAIYMARNQLSGNIPPQLSKLTKLLDLELANNQLSGSIPAQLGDLPNLTNLYLDYNQLTGSIPAQLSNRTGLLALTLCCNQLTGNIPPQFGNLTNLVNLTLSGNQLSGNIPTQLGNLTKLTVLGLCCNQLSGNAPTQLGNLAKLGFLSLDNNQLSGNLPTQFGNLLNLTGLHVEYNALSGALPNSLTNLSKLATFWFNNTSLCEPIDSAFQNWLVNITSLQRTSLCAANITVQFGATTYTVNENGQVGGFQDVTLSAPSSQPVTVQFTTSNGTATAGSDYTAQNITLTFNPNQTSRSFAVPILEDNVDENDETVNLTLSNPTNAVLGTQANATLTIIDNDAPPACPTCDSDGDGTPDGSDPAPLDPCSPNPNASACPTGDTDGDGIPNGSDPAPTNPCVPNGNAPICPSRTVQFNSENYSVNESGSAVNIQVTLSAASSGPVTVHYATNNGTATAGSDYTAKSGTLTFNPGQTSQTFTVPITDDNFDEADETVNLTLSSPTNAMLGTPANATLTIIDNGSTCYTLTMLISPSGGGTVATSPQSNCQGNKYTQGTVVSLSATANAGYGFSQWSGSVNSPVNPLTITMDADKSFTANFNVVPPTDTPTLAATSTPPGNPPTSTPSPSGGTWVSEIIHEGAGGDINIAFALTASGEPHVSLGNIFFGTQICPVYHYFKNGAQWTVEKASATQETCAGYLTTAIAMDQSGAPYVVYDAGPHFTQTKALMYARRTNNSWITEPIDANASANDSALALDGNNHPHVLYHGTGGLHYAWQTDAVWQNEVVDASGTDGALVLDSAGTPHLLYSVGNTIWYARKIGDNNWDKQAVTSAGGNSLSLAVDSAGNPHLGYIDPPTKQVKYAYRVGTQWNFETVEGDPNQHSKHVLLALDYAGNPSMSYDDGISVMYTRRTGNTWVREIVDFIGGDDARGVYGLAFDGADNPHLLYKGVNLIHVYKHNGSAATATPTPTVIATPTPAPGVFVTNFALTEGALISYPGPNALLIARMCQAQVLWLQLTNNGPATFAGGSYTLQWTVTKNGQTVENYIVPAMFTQSLPSIQPGEQVNVPVTIVGFLRPVEDGEFVVKLTPDSTLLPPFPQNPSAKKIKIDAELNLILCTTEYVLRFEALMTKWITGLSKWTGNIVGTGSPVYPLVTNSNGQRAGFLANGQIIEEIPGSHVVAIGEERIVTYPGLDAVQVDVVGYANGSMTLVAGFVHPDGTGTLVTHENAPVTQGMLASLSSVDADFELAYDFEQDSHIDVYRTPDRVESIQPSNYIYLPLIMEK